MRYAVINKSNETLYGIFDGGSVDEALKKWANACGVDSYDELTRQASGDISRDNLLVMSDRENTPWRGTKNKLDYIIGINKNDMGDSVFYNTFVKYGVSCYWYASLYDRHMNRVNSCDLNHKSYIGSNLCNCPLALVPECVIDALLAAIPDDIFDQPLA